jgi:hypothetical protein
MASPNSLRVTTDMQPSVEDQINRLERLAGPVIRATDGLDAQLPECPPVPYDPTVRSDLTDGRSVMAPPSFSTRFALPSEI